MTACNNDHPSDSQSSTKKESANEVAAGSTNYLDFKNGFRDVAFGQHAESIKDLVLLREEKLGTNLATEYKRANDILSLNEIPLENITYRFFNNELCMISMGWNIPSTNVVVHSIPEVTALLGIMQTNFILPFPSGLKDFIETLYGKPTELESKDTDVPSSRGKEVIGRTTTATWTGKKVTLHFFESQSRGIFSSGWPAKTSGAMDIADIERVNKAQQIAIQEEANKAAQKKDGL